MTLLKRALIPGASAETHILARRTSAASSTQRLTPCDKEFLLESRGDNPSLDALQDRIQKGATAELASCLGFSSHDCDAWRQTREFVALSDAIEEAFVKVRNAATARRERSAGWKWKADFAKTGFERQEGTWGEVQRVATWVSINATDANEKLVLHHTYFVEATCYERCSDWVSNLYRDPYEPFVGR